MSLNLWVLWKIKNDFSIKIDAIKKEFSHIGTDIRQKFLSSNAFTRFLTGGCNNQFIDKEVCKNILYEICGPSISINISRIPVYLKHFPGGTSTKNMVHFGQLVINGK